MDLVQILHIYIYIYVCVCVCVCVFVCARLKARANVVQNVPHLKDEQVRAGTSVLSLLYFLAKEEISAYEITMTSVHVF